MVVLGIETSCDETAAAVVEDGEKLLSSVVWSSMDLHTVYGGVVPEIAARSHIESIIPVIEQALNNAFPPQSSIPNLQSSDPWDQIDAIAVVNGAGLGGSLLVGVTTAKELAILKDKPLYSINHVEAHVYASFLTSSKKDWRLENGDWRIGGKDYQFPVHKPKFPLLALIVSGGHTQLALFNDHFEYELLGQTRDDAVGEAFDKVAKIIGLPYPGGPNIEKASLDGDPFKFQLPKAKLKGASESLIKLRTSWGAGSDAMQGSSEDAQRDVPNSTVSEQRSSETQQSAERDSSISSSARKQAGASSTSGYDFSFSGLKTAVLRLVQSEISEDYTFPSYKIPDRLSDAQRADIAASFQRVAIETAVDKTITAYKEFGPKSIVIAGGVAASQELRQQLKDRLQELLDPQGVSSDAMQGSSEDAQRVVHKGTASEDRNSETQQSAESAGSVAGSAGNQARAADILRYPDMKLCTDNGAMVATLGCFKAMFDQPPADPYSLEIDPSLSM